MIRLCLLLVFVFGVASDERTKYDIRLQSQNGYDPNVIFGGLPLPPNNFPHARSLLYAKCRCAETKSADPIILKIRTGAFLRYNLIKVFGYILHRKNIELNTAYYTSLYFILTCIKLNHVDILSMTSVLKEIGFEKPNQQFIKIFESMEKHLPVYLRCAARYWKDGIKKKEINMDNIIMPYGDNTVVINILEGLLPSEVDALKVNETLEEAKTEEEKKIIYNFNINVLHMVKYIEKKKEFKPHSWFIVGLLQFLPRTLIQPDVEESIQLLTYYFYDKEGEIYKLIGIIDIPKDHREPYKMIRFVLEKVFNGKNTADVIKDAADTIIRNLKPRSPTAVNPHYSSFTFFIQPDSIQIDEMLKYVSKCAFPLEIILAAERVRYYINVRIIGYFTLMNNFNPYLYSSPMEVLIAILDRIMRREPNLSPEILNAVGAVYSYLIFKFRYSTMPVVYPTEMININILFMGMKAPDIPRNIRQFVDELLSYLMMEPLKYSELLIKNVPIYKCTTPVICLYYLLEQLIKNEEMIGGDIKGVVIQLRNCTCMLGNCPINEKQDKDDVFPVDLWEKLVKQWEEPPVFQATSTTAKPTTKSTSHTVLSTSTTTKTTTTITTKPPPQSPSEGPNKTQSTLGQTDPTTPTVPPASQDYPTLPTPPGVTAVMPDDDKLIFELIKNITEDYACDIGLNREQLKEIMGILQQHEGEIKQLKGHHITLISGYLTYLELIKEKHTSEVFKEFASTVANYTSIVEVFLQNMETNMTQPALGELIVALPTPETDEERKMFSIITGILSRQELFFHIQKHITKKDTLTTGTLLKAVIREEIKLIEKLTKVEIEALKYYSDKVQEKGFGERKVRYGIIQKVLTMNVSISNIMDKALDFKKLDNDNKKAFNTIIKFLKSNKVVLQNWSTWYLHTSCGKFTQAMFKMLLSTPSVDTTTRKAVNALTPLVNLDKNGLQPAFLNKGKGFS